MPIADFLFYIAVLLGLSAVVSCAPVQTPLEKAAAAAAGVKVSAVDVDTPLNRLYRDAVRVRDNIKEFLSILADFDQLQANEADRELEIRQYGVKRGNTGFKVNGWKRKRRSTMESDIIAAAFTNKLDHKAADMVHTIYTFLDDLQIARQYYEGVPRGPVTRSVERGGGQLTEN
ncbi:uncharacterized protein [Diadema antillarum]|uniref:uncharacterized protein n=1 Tax=Diadema antillarum TaxID=105358 RepID=UPI003A88EA2A